MAIIRRFLLAYRAPIVAGIFIGTSYIPFPPWASMFAFVPLWIFWLAQAERGESLKKIFLAGWITQFVLTLIGFNWIAHLAKEFGHFPWAVAIVTLLLFCAFANLYVPLAGIISFYLFK